MTTEQAAPIQEETTGAPAPELENAGENDCGSDCGPRGGSRGGSRGGGS